MSTAKFGVVIPTIGESSRLPEVLEALSTQMLPPTIVVVVWQADPESKPGFLTTQNWPFDLVLCDSQPGLSAARNLGMSKLRDRVDYVAFPDDDIVFEDFALVNAAELLRTRFDAVSGKLYNEGTSISRINFPEEEMILSRSSVWSSSIEAVTMYRLQCALELGFDERLGLGAKTSFQSGEGTDLLLRCMRKGLQVGFSPKIQAVELDTNPDLRISVAERRRKARVYAAGTGAVYRKNYSAGGCWGLVVRSVAAFVLDAVRGRWVEAWIRLNILSGRVYGLLARRLDG